MHTNQPADQLPDEHATQSTPEQSHPSNAADRRALLAGISGLAAGALLAGAKTAHAGPLTPPSGAIASTGKPLSEIEPRIAISGPTVISADGSYYLTGNISASAGGNGLNITAANVTVDLNGCTISGGQTGILISSASPAGNIVIQNGTIRNTSGSGIFASSANSPPVAVRNVRLHGITDAGVFLRGLAVVENVSVSPNPSSTTSSGITVGTGSRVSDCRVETVALRGIDAGGYARIDNVLVFGAGSDAIRVGSYSRITNATAQGGSTGFNIGQYSTVISCTAANTTGTGFLVDAGGTLKDCNATGTISDAFTIGPGGSVLDCSANTILGDAFKTTATGGVTFDRCSAFNIALNGFNIISGSVVTNSTVSSIGNLSNVGTIISSGVLVNGPSNRIEGNRLISCGYPVFIVAGATSNAVYRNAAFNGFSQYTNNGGALNQIGTVRTNTAAVGPWDNTFQ